MEVRHHHQTAGYDKGRTMRVSEMLKAINKILEVGTEDAELHIVNEDGYHFTEIENVYFESKGGDNEDVVCIEIGSH